MNKKHKVKKSTVFSIVFIAAVLILTVISVMTGEDPQAVIDGIKTADGRYLLGAVICILFFVILQGVVIYLMCRALDLNEGLWKCILMAFHGYFFCNITPMQTGGPVIQIYDMKKEGIRVPVACMIIFNMTFLFKMVLFVITVGLIFFGRGLISTYMHGIIPLVILGIFLTLSFTIFIGFMIFNTRLTKKLALKLYDWAVRKHIIKKKIEERRTKLIGLLDQYRDVAGFFMTHKSLMLILFLITFAQRMLYFSSTYFVYRSLGLSGTPWFTICMLQASINIIADLLPVPGGAGVSEMVFSVIFAKVFGDSVSSGMLLSRGIAYYAQLIMCGIMTLAAGWTFRLDRSKMGRYQKTWWDQM